MLARPDLLNMGPVKDLWELADRLDMMPANDDATAAAGFDINRSEVTKETDHPCGTAGCIGGWVELWNGRHEGKFPLQTLSESVAKLGCSLLAADDLCWGYPNEHITPQQAARAVRILAETGKCDWPRALREVPTPTEGEE